MDQPKFISSLLEDVIAASQIPPEQLLNDDDERTRALTAARQLANALEKPANAGFAASFLVSLLSQLAPRYIIGCWN